MSDLSYFVVQKSIIERLRGDAALMAKVTGVNNFTIGNTNFPYVVIGDPVDNAEVVLGAFGQDIVMQIHAYSRYAGAEEVYSILQDIVRLLGNKILALEDGWTGTGSWYMGTRVFTEGSPDSQTYHGVTRYRYRTLKPQDENEC